MTSVIDGYDVIVVGAGPVGLILASIWVGAVSAAC
jgi:threonine dehydrogenase-like Zn-dependent dehydrogenase